eukprot:4506099-Pyramimonas_sp.AAC.1
MAGWLDGWIARARIDGTLGPRAEGAADLGKFPAPRPAAATSRRGPRPTTRPPPQAHERHKRPEAKQPKIFPATMRRSFQALAGFA